MLSVRRYQDASLFLDEARQTLELNEIEHSFLLWAASELAKKELGNSYCGAVWNGAKLVYAIVALDQSTAWTSLLLDETVEPRQVIKMLVDDLCAAPVVIKRIQGDSDLAFVKEAWNGKLDLNFKLWNYIYTRDDLSSLDKKNDDDFFLRPAVSIELPLLVEWTNLFYVDSGLGHIFTEEQIYFDCADQIKGGTAYFWCHRSKGPLSMIWKRRPMPQGCSIGYVYTPRTLRGHGYGGSMVTAFTRMLLQDFTYITLSMDGRRDPKENMYARVGYRLVGKRLEYLPSDS